MTLARRTKEMTVLTPLCIQSLSRDALQAELKVLAQQCSNAEALKAKVAERLPGVAVTSCHHGPLVMGMAMSLYHEGIIQF